MDHRRPFPHANPAPRSAPRVLIGLQIAALVILIGWALHATATVSALILSALFLAILVAPFHRWTIAKTGHRWIGHVSAFLLILVVLLVFAACLFFAAQRIAAEFSSAAEMLPGLDPGSDPSAGDSVRALERMFSNANQAVSQIATRMAEFASGIALTGIEYAAATLSGLVVAIFLALLVLIDAPRWRARIASVFGTGAADETGDAVAVMSRDVLRFVAVRAALGAVTAVLYMLWLWPFGVGLIFVWGALTFLLNFIPNLGSIVAGILPTIYALLTKDFGTAIIVAAGLTVIEQVIGNYVDPRVQGHEVSISPVVIFVGLLVFGWVWGLLGALLSTPVLIVTTIACSRIGRLRPVSLMLSNVTSYDELDKVTRL
ncbi:AI-2E family transporter [Marivita sp. GX14005]|uniref:AI-2E family transporter n=1 Tax=Marivita sp. GX14005 TaxID=2942276 RepID=UPI002019E000|nr:AI-2E family transporter [Marivita sp. GX14005]MCL3882007.1 AI-2E family transporter [Marivita sp. GX14005]